MVQRDFFAFCKSLRLVELKAIGSLSTVKHFGENEVIYSSEGDGSELFIVTRGAVELFPQNARPGAPTTVLSRGDIFGETGALMEHPRDHSARACAALSVQCFRRSDFSELLQRGRRNGADRTFRSPDRKRSIGTGGKTMKKLYPATACLVAAATLLPGCSMLTAQGRQERAYTRYVHKMSAGRSKQQKRFFTKQKNTIPVTQPTEPVITSEASGPESFSDGGGATGKSGGQ